MITRIAALTLLGALSLRVGAEEPVNLIYKCVNKAGTQYQSQPCAKGETVHIRLSDPAPVSPEAAAANQRYLDDLRQQNAAAIAPRPAPTRPVYNNGGGGGRLHHISQYKDPDACEAAKAERARVYEAVGLHRSFELSRRMDDKVWSACK
ncbi:hypothetical protein I5U23_16570 [Stenotrophomonas maltophilia]|uniref:DUF4124 domain-containing protein n=1 Tax=Stenotrophomonas riyadhensis TaxID=2859893 RepID=A0ABT2XCC8_9GAMM|nr:hypothetical protein [Stenotrophomonas sp. CFS3442]MBH1619535.1 hypothetical protein [Stenotrophomonas maltophilia]MCV0323599.1 hypothetical protein [Stenotrophomonas sp. CFS3442]HEL4242962.1 hypothetical protein [Stenotrophomonas maltophilia]